MSYCSRSKKGISPEKKTKQRVNSEPRNAGACVSLCHVFLRKKAPEREHVICIGALKLGITEPSLLSVSMADTGSRAVLFAVYCIRCASVGFTTHLHIYYQSVGVFSCSPFPVILSSAGANAKLAAVGCLLVSHYDGSCILLSLGSCSLLTNEKFKW